MEKQLIICTHQRLTDQTDSCGGRDAETLANALESLIAKQELPIKLCRIDCLGRCHEGPNIRLAPGGSFYTQVTPEQLPAILEEAVSFLSPEPPER